MKCCSICKIDKPISDYYFNNSKGYYNSECKECNIIRSREYRKQNKDKIFISRKEYREKNASVIQKKKREYYIQNKDKVIENNRVNHRHRYAKDLLFRTKENYRRHLNIYIKKYNQEKTDHTLEYLGCSIKYLVEVHLKKECEYCGSTEYLQVDHIYPVSKSLDIKKVWNYKNLQTLCKKCNLEKRDKIIMLQ